MKTPEVTNCCGLSLKHGTIVIGVVQSILAFMLLILSAAYAENPHELIDMSDPSIVPDINVLRGLLITVAVASAIQCILSIIIIFGAETNRPYLLAPWLIFNPLALLVYIVAVFIAILEHTNDNNAYFIIGHLLVGSVVCAIAFFKILVVHSFYKHLRSLNF